MDIAIAIGIRAVGAPWELVGLDFTCHESLIISGSLRRSRRGHSDSAGWDARHLVVVLIRAIGHCSSEPLRGWGSVGRGRPGAHQSRLGCVVLMHDEADKKREIAEKGRVGGKKRVWRGGVFIGGKGAMGAGIVELSAISHLKGG